MVIPNKQVLQKFVFNNSSDIEDFINLYKKCIVQPHYFLVIDATLVSDNPSRFRKEALLPGKIDR